MAAKYPEHIVEYILQNYKGVGPKEMAEKLNAQFGTSYTRNQIKCFYGNHKLNSGVTGYFPKGIVPPNKGKKGVCSPGSEKGWFKKGQVPPNKTEIGAIRLRGDGYLWEKYGPGQHDWKPHHQLVWERAHGKQPEGYVLVFKDGDRMNCDLSNLELVSWAENLELNRSGLRSSNADLTESAIMVARVRTTIRNLQKERESV